MGFYKGYPNSQAHLFGLRFQDTAFLGRWACSSFISTQGYEQCIKMSPTSGCFDTKTAQWLSRFWFCFA